MYKAIAFDDALRLFEADKPQVVLLDMHFPENKSFDLLKEIKTTGYKRYLIALSIYWRFNEREQCKQLGADCCLDK